MLGKTDKRVMTGNGIHLVSAINGEEWKEEGRGKREEGRGKREEGRGKRE